MEFFKANIIPAEVLVQMIAFIIVFWTLKLLAWKPILGSLEARRQKIKSEFDKIEHARKEIEALKAQYAASIQKIEDEARAKMLESVEEGRKIAKEIQEKARAESQASFEKAKDNLAIETAKARITLRREIADLAVSVSEKVLREKLTEAKQQEKIMGLIEELEKT
ncbi:MAG: F0F1 ATP synthase subunit B [Candidatus Omnitrophica bacterium]|nr:F0F1 ATP synthase subunit B [Candidatus Omnitrophota bacterium]